METVQAEIEADEANITQQPNSNLLPFIETVRFEVESLRGKLEAVRTENQRLHIELGNSGSEKEFFRQEVQELRSQLETERASREEIQVELSKLNQNFAPAATLSEKLTPDAATILSQLARQAQKVKNRFGGLGSHIRNFGKLRR
jgi:chromosome segregation ATPase